MQRRSWTFYKAINVISLINTTKVKSMANYRKEKDSLGTIDVPESAYFGASTQRAVENFPISGLTFPLSFIYSLALVKKCSAMVNN